MRTTISSAAVAVALVGLAVPGIAYAGGEGQHSDHHGWEHHGKPGDHGPQCGPPERPPAPPAPPAPPETPPPPPQSPPTPPAPPEVPAPPVVPPPAAPAPSAPVIGTPLSVYAPKARLAVRGSCTGGWRVTVRTHAAVKRVTFRADGHRLQAGHSRTLRLRHRDRNDFRKVRVIVRFANGAERVLKVTVSDCRKVYPGRG